MGSDRRALLLVVCFMVLAGFGASATFICDGVFQIQGSIGRSLLQAKKSCPVNFEFMNYTIITSKCKGPKYPADLCCGALKDFACPYSEELNDLTNDCASTMFSYINLYGRYPPGLFASECKDSKRGLECPTSSEQSANDTASAGHTDKSFSMLIVFVSGFALHYLLN